MTTRNLYPHANSLDMICMNDFILRVITIQRKTPFLSYIILMFLVIKDCTCFVRCGWSIACR